MLLGLGVGVAIAAAASGWVVGPALTRHGAPPNVPVSQEPTTLEPQTLTSTVSFGATIGYQPLAVAATAQNSGILTGVPPAGSVVSQGQPIFQINGAPVILLYGSVPEWRSLAPGVSPGADVVELEQDLNQLGDSGATKLPTNGEYSAAVGLAVERFLRSEGLPPSTSLPQGTVLFLPGAVFVSKVAEPLGATVEPSQAVLDVSSTQRVVTGAYTPDGGLPVATGQRATVTPDSGGPSLRGSVAAVSTSTTGGSTTVTVTITLSGSPSLPAGNIPAEATVVTRTLHGVLAVPVQALVALVNGGYALEERTRSGRDRLIGVQVGASGNGDLVQVTGNGVRPGLRVLVPTLY